MADALNSLGGPIRKTIMWHLESNGKDIEHMNPSEVASMLRPLLGPGADMLVKEMFRQYDNGAADTEGKS